MEPVQPDDAGRTYLPPLQILLRGHRRTAQPEVLLHAAAVPAQHGLHHPDIAVHIHGVGVVQGIQLALEARHDAVHGAADLLLCLGKVLAADPRLLEVGIGVQQLLRGGQVIVQEGGCLIFLGGVLLHQLQDLPGDLLQPVDFPAQLRVCDAVVGAAMLDRRKIRYTYLKLSKKIKDFLLSDKSREFLIFLFFFLIAGGFWLLQTLNNDYEAEFSIPVRVKDLPNNVVLTSEPPSELRVRVKDKGTVLLNYMLGKSFFPVNLSFLDYKGKNNHVKIYASDFEKKILSQLNVSSKILSIKPDTLEYIYSEGKSKLVPVRLQGKVTAGLQYYVSDTICNPDSVLVYAPEGILDTITTAYTQKINLENISDTTRQRISLAPLRGVKFVPSSVEATFPVDIYTEKTVEVPLHGINFPADKALRAFPSKVQITFQVGLKRFRSIKADDFVINVSYEELLKLGSDKYTVKLKSFPNGINQIRIVPEQVDFLIEQVSSFSDVD